MSRLALFAAIAALAMSANVPPPPEREPIEPEPDPLRPTGRCRCFGEGRCEWCRGARLREPDRDSDLTAIAAAQAKRDRKNRKRLQELP